MLLEVKNLHAKVTGEDKQILNGVNLVIREGEVSLRCESLASSASSVQTFNNSRVTA